MGDGDAATTSFADLQERVVALRDSLRRHVGFEQGAWGVDGHTFSYDVALSRPLPVGGYVVLTARDGRRYLGQIVELLRMNSTVDVDHLGARSGSCRRACCARPPPSSSVRPGGRTHQLARAAVS